MHDFLALDAAEHLLVAFLEAALADVVAALVVGVTVEVSLVDLADIAEHLCRYGTVVDAKGTLGDVEALETEHFVLELRVIFFRDLFYEDGGRIGGVLAGLVHALVEIAPSDFEALAEVVGVEVFHHAGDDHEVVHRFVVHQELAVAVVDESTGGVLRDVAQRLLGALFPVFGVEYLQYRQTPYK